MTIFQTYFGVFLGTAILMITQSTFAANCESSEARDATARVLDQNGNLRSRIMEQDYFIARPCLDDVSSIGVAQIDEKLLSKEYRLLFCNVEVTDRGKVCRSDHDAFEVLPEWDSFCENPEKCMLHYYVVMTPTEFTNFGAAGGVPLGWLLGHIGKKGHYEITTGALKDFGEKRKIKISNGSVENMSTASQDPDFYHWTDAAAHGQTPNDDSTAELIPGQAAAKFIGWVDDYLRKAEGNCREGKSREAIYLIGYALHAVQDVVFHDGMSNAEHAYRDKYRTRVDTEYWYDEKMLLAREASLAILAAMFPEKPTGNRSCSASILNRDGVSKLRSDEKILLIGKNQWELTPNTYRTFTRLAPIMLANAYCEKCIKAKYIVEPNWLIWEKYFKTPEGLDSIRTRLRSFTDRILSLGESHK